MLGVVTMGCFCRVCGRPTDCHGELCEIHEGCQGAHNEPPSKVCYPARDSHADGGS